MRRQDGAQPSRRGSRSQSKDCSHDDDVIKATIPRNQCAHLKDGEARYCFIGLVRGLPIYLKIHRSKQQQQREQDDGERSSSSFDVSMGWSTGGLSMPGEHSEEMVPGVKFGFQSIVAPGEHYYYGGRGVDDDVRVLKENETGYHGCLGPWEEVLAPTSNKFIDGVMEVHLRLCVYP